MKNTYIIIALVALLAVVAGFWLMGQKQSPPGQLPVSAERQQQCEEFLMVALFPNDGSADRFLEACLRGEPVLPGEAEEEPPLPTGPSVAPGCAVGGCSSQVCGEAGEVEGIMTTCEWRSEYACYAVSRCERQASGQCGWTETAEYTQCMNNDLDEIEVF